MKPPRLRAVLDGGAAGLLSPLGQVILYLVKAAVLTLAPYLSIVGETLALYVLVLLLEHMLNTVLVFIHVTGGVTSRLLLTLEQLGILFAGLLGYYYYKKAREEKERTSKLPLIAYIAVAVATYYIAYRFIKPVLFPALDTGIAEVVKKLQGLVDVSRLVLDAVVVSIVHFLLTLLVTYGLGVLGLLRDWACYMIAAVLASLVITVFSFGIHYWGRVQEKWLGMLATWLGEKPVWFLLAAILSCIPIGTVMVFLTVSLIMVVLAVLAGMIIGSVFAGLSVNPLAMISKILFGTSGISASLWTQWLINKFSPTKLDKTTLTSVTLTVVLVLLSLALLFKTTLVDYIWLAYTLYIILTFASILLTGIPTRPKRQKQLFETIGSFVLAFLVASYIIKPLACMLYGIVSAVQALVDIDAENIATVFCKDCIDMYHEWLNIGNAACAICEKLYRDYEIPISAVCTLE